MVADYARWVMVRKRDPNSAATSSHVPEIPQAVPLESLELPAGVRLADYDVSRTGSRFLWDEYVPGERLDHVDGATVEEVEQMMVTRLYQNNAPVHLNEHLMKSGRFGRTIAAKNVACADYPHRDAKGDYHPAVILDLDYSVLIPRRSQFAHERSSDHGQS